MGVLFTSMLVSLRMSEFDARQVLDLIQGQARQVDEPILKSYWGRMAREVRREISASYATGVIEPDQDKQQGG